MNILQRTFPLIIALSALFQFSLIAQNIGIDQQLRLHVKQNGKIQFIDFALSKTYFSKATDNYSEITDEQDSEFTTKGTNPESYEKYAYFLIQNKIIVAYSDKGSFADETSGIYTLSAYSYPSEISADAFIGKSFKTIENHPMFRKDRDVHRLMVTLIVPEKEQPVAVTSSEDAEKAIIIGEEIEASLSGSN